jgi:hypothetical protein
LFSREPDTTAAVGSGRESPSRRFAPPWFRGWRGAAGHALLRLRPIALRPSAFASGRDSQGGLTALANSTFGLRHSSFESPPERFELPTPSTGRSCSIRGLVRAVFCLDRRPLGGVVALSREEVVALSCSEVAALFCPVSNHGSSGPGREAGLEGLHHNGEEDGSGDGDSAKTNYLEGVWSRPSKISNHPCLAYRLGRVGNWPILEWSRWSLLLEEVGQEVAGLSSCRFRKRGR